MRYRIEASRRGGGEVITLRDDETGASAAILPSFGFNLFELRLPVAGKVQTVSYAADDFADRPSSPGRNGTPILFPFPNRIAGGRYEFGGKAYQLAVNSGTHAIHGFAIQAPWDVVERRADDRGASVTGRYQISVQSPEALETWPSDAILEVKYTLAGRGVTLDATVTNPTAGTLPYGFGIHPYYRLPLAPGGDPKRTKVIIPAAESWVLEGYIPTGERRPVDARLDFRQGQPLLGLKLDDVLTGLPRSGDRACRLVDENVGAEFRLDYGPEFREIVAFTPPTPDGVIAIEPYTQTTDAIHLHARGIDGGLRVLDHGARETLRITMETRG